MTKMDVAGEPTLNFDGVSTLIEAAKYLERQEKQRRILETSYALPSVENSRNREEDVVSTHEQPVVKRLKTSPGPNSNHNTLLYTVDLQPASHPPSRLGTREVHNKLEKNRRAHLKQCFELLKKHVPISPDEKKISNLNILHSATKYIQALRRKDREYEYELEKLARQKIALQQHLAVLKRERSESSPMTSSVIIEERESRVTPSPPMRSQENMIPPKIQVVPSVGSSASTAGLLVSSGPTVQLLPPSALRGIPVPNGVLSHGRVTLATSDSNQLIQQAAHMVISQANGGSQVLLPLTSPTIGAKMLQMPVVNLVKPAVVVVSSPSNSTH
ncbi:hypothetical protein LSTR_LSTR006494 [Laodelphax striatellus]|uniref:Max-binding protein MNT n=1 Tax=Laodelphax striatellus TaxID=195883 RepID=A0A482WX64_LAOST|nr:hypothetical protein LSTR_LSTR006494 [Laodelphax striatellus]